MLHAACCCMPWRALGVRDLRSIPQKSDLPNGDITTNTPKHAVTLQRSHICTWTSPRPHKRDIEARAEQEQESKSVAKKDRLQIRYLGFCPRWALERPLSAYCAYRVQDRGEARLSSNGGSFPREQASHKAACLSFDHFPFRAFLSGLLRSKLSV